MSESESSSDEEVEPIVIDNGSFAMKAGYGGDEVPRTIFPTVWGRQKNPGILVGCFPMKQDYVGDEAVLKHGILTLKYPIQKGIIVDWEGMEKIWWHLFYNELRISPEEHPVLLTEPVLNPSANREKTVKTMFDAFSIPAVYVATDSVLALFSTGRRTGIVLDSGYEVTHCVPIYQGYPLSHAIRRLDLGGRDLTTYLLQLLKKRGYSLTTKQARDIKETIAYIVEDFEKQLGKDVREKIYELPNGKKIAIGSELFCCPEILFQPTQYHEGIKEGIHMLILDAICKSDQDIRKELFQNIVLTGGTTMIDGISNRLLRDLKNNLVGNFPVRIIAREHRNHAAWCGGSALSVLSTFQHQWITYESYKESGKVVQKLGL